MTGTVMSVKDRRQVEGYDNVQNCRYSVESTVWGVSKGSDELVRIVG